MAIEQAPRPSLAQIGLLSTQSGSATGVRASRLLASTKVNRISLGAVAATPIDALVAKAFARAQQKLPGAQIQRVEYTQHAGKGAVMVSFEKPGHNDWYALRLSKTGKKLWEHQSKLDSPSRLPMLPGLPSAPISMKDALSAGLRLMPKADFNHGSLGVRADGGIEYDLFHTWDWKNQPVVTVDGQTGAITVKRFDATAHDFVPV